MNTWQKKLDFIVLLAGVGLALFANILPWLYLVLPLVLFGLSFNWADKKRMLIDLGISSIFLLSYLGFFQLAILDVFSKSFIAAVVVLLCFFYFLTKHRIRSGEIILLISLLFLAFIAFSVYGQFKIPYFWVILGFGAVSTLPVFFWLFEQKPAKFALLFALFVAVALLQIFFILSFWPVALAIKAGIAAIFFYAIFGILSLYFAGTLEWKKVWSYLGISIGLFVLLFATTKWLPFVE